MKKTTVFIVCCLWLAMPSAVWAQSFPIGWFDLLNQDQNPANDPAEVAAAGANYVVAVRPWPDYGQDIQDYLSTAAQQGITVVLDIRYVVDNLNTGSGYEDILTTIAITYGNHPALSGWFIAEKPSLYPQYSQLNCQTAYSIINTHSDRPIYMLFSKADMDVNNPSNYSPYYDVMMMECSPANQTEPEFTDILDWKNTSIQARQQATALGKPLHNILQALGDASSVGGNYRLPTKQEERFMVYYSILTANADGLAFWAHNYAQDSIVSDDVYIYDGPQWLKDVAMPIGLELRSYVNAIHNRPIPNAVNDSNASISSQVYTDPQNRKYYLLSVNNDSIDVGSVAFTLNLPLSFNYAIPMTGDAPWIPIVNGSFPASFSSYQVNNYELLPTVRTCQDIIAEGCGVVGDLNHDCYVTVADIAALAESWLNCNDPANQDCGN